MESAPPTRTSTANRADAPTCGACGYDLGGAAPSAPCPECGSNVRAPDACRNAWRTFVTALAWLCPAWAGLIAMQNRMSTSGFSGAASELSPLVGSLCAAVMVCVTLMVAAMLAIVGLDASKGRQPRHRAVLIGIAVLTFLTLALARHPKANGPIPFAGVNASYLAPAFNWTSAAGWLNLATEILLPGGVLLALASIASRRRETGLARLAMMAGCCSMVALSLARGARAALAAVAMSGGVTQQLPAFGNGSRAIAPPLSPPAWEVALSVLSGCSLPVTLAAIVGAWCFTLILTDRSDARR